MTTDETNDNYTQNHNIENSQNLITQNHLTQKIDLNNIQSINDLNHNYIQQPNPNEFYIKYNGARWIMC